MTESGESLSGPRTVQIPRLDEDARQFCDDYVGRNRPVLITGAVSAPAFDEWTFDWFRERYGDRDVGVIKVAETRAEYGATYDPIKLGQYIDEITTNLNSPWYMSESRLVEELPELTRMVPHPPHFPKDRALEHRLWIGPANSISHFHKDNHFSFARIESLFIQLRGEKRFVLVSPDHDEFMYPAPNDGDFKENYAFQGLVDCECPDFERFPLYRNAVLHEATVGRGEMLYIPAGWWHYVRALTPCISVSNWWLETRIADVVSRLIASEDASGFVAEHAGSLTVGDLRSFFGGLPLLTEALVRFEKPQLEAVLALFEPAARAEISANIGAVHSS